MDEAQFWTIIEAGGSKAPADPERQLAAARKRLAKLSSEEIRDFHRFFNQKVADAYTWDLWGAGYLINGGCSDDGFHYFRAWVISRGRAVYEAAVANPDSLAGLTDPDRDDYETDLCLRPIFHHKEARADAHVLFAVLAYALSVTIQLRHREQGGTLTSVALLESLKGIQLAELSFRTAQGECLRYERASIPSAEQQALLDSLGWPIPEHYLPPDLDAEPARL